MSDTYRGPRRKRETERRRARLFAATVRLYGGGRLTLPDATEGRRDA